MNSSPILMALLLGLACSSLTDSHCIQFNWDETCNKCESYYGLWLHTHECYQCADHCDSCYFNSQVPPWYNNQWNGICSSCDSLQYYINSDTYDNSCHLCPKGCSKCKSSEVCLTCEENFLMQDGRCLSNCTSITDCYEFDLSPICDSSNKRCRSCQLDSECREIGFKYCDTNQDPNFSGQCTNECVNLTDCSQVLPVLILESDLTLQTTVCTTNADCADNTDWKLICNSNTSTCTVTCPGYEYLDSCNDLASALECECGQSGVDTKYYCKKEDDGKNYCNMQYCFHKSSIVSVLQDNKWNKITLDQLKIGDIVKTYDHQTNSYSQEPILVSIVHQSNELVPMLTLTFISDTENGTLSLAPHHYLFVKKQGHQEVIRITSIEAAVGDILIIVNNDKATEAVISSIKEIFVPSNDLIAPYTASAQILVNNVYASCQSQDDASEYFLSAFEFIHKYISPSIPQALAEFSQSYKLPSYYRRVKEFF